MKNINSYIEEKLQLNKQTQTYDVDINTLTDEIYDHLTILRKDFPDEEKCKRVIKEWIEENNVNEVEYWTGDHWFDEISKVLYKKVKSSDYKHAQNIDHIIGDVAERRKDTEYYINFSTAMYTSKKYVAFWHNETIYAVKKS